MWAALFAAAVALAGKAFDYFAGKEKRPPVPDPPSPDAPAWGEIEAREDAEIERRKKGGDA